MIKIDLQQETAALSKNPVIKEFLNNPTINLQQKYFFQDISFNHLNQMLDRLAPGYDDVMICVISSQGYDDLLTERAALRMYDGTFGDSSGTDLAFHTQRGTVRIVAHSLMDKDGVLFLKPDNADALRNSKITIKTDQLEFTQSTDFSKVKFNVVHATKFNNER